MTTTNSPSLIDESPVGTFALSSRDVAGFMGTLRQKYGVSAGACAIAEELLVHCFGEFGGYDEPASNLGAKTLIYHNGSHAAYVMTVGVHLGFRGGASQQERDALLIAGAGHDYLHRSTVPGEDEANSAKLVSERVRASPLRELALLVHDLVIGTTVEQIDHTEIRQRAAHSSDSLGQFLADADLASFATPYAGDWALKLYKELHAAGQQNQQSARTFLEQTAYYQRNHQYLSQPGRDLLGRQAPIEATRLEASITELIANFPA